MTRAGLEPHLESEAPQGPARVFQLECPLSPTPKGIDVHASLTSNVRG